MRPRDWYRRRDVVRQQTREGRGDRSHVCRRSVKRWHGAAAGRDEFVDVSHLRPERVERFELSIRFDYHPDPTVDFVGTQRASGSADAEDAQRAGFDVGGDLSDQRSSCRRRHLVEELTDPEGDRRIDHDVSGGERRWQVFGEDSGVGVHLDVVADRENAFS
ncbi:hypothetical protein Amsp01_074260 [Amycolatopsis sp. NBRC 101858]|nr:hypothetical protein Amsp01_074260 [Amycolatopsis sp. NBRC 101858]